MDTLSSLASGFFNIAAAAGKAIGKMLTGEKQAPAEAVETREISSKSSCQCKDSMRADSDVKQKMSDLLGSPNSSTLAALEQALPGLAAEASKSQGATDEKSGEPTFDVSEEAGRAAFGLPSGGENAATAQMYQAQTAAFNAALDSGNPLQALDKIEEEAASAVPSSFKAPGYTGRA